MSNGPCGEHHLSTGVHFHRLDLRNIGQPPPKKKKKQRGSFVPWSPFQPTPKRAPSIKHKHRLTPHRIALERLLPQLGGHRGVEAGQGQVGGIAPQACNDIVGLLAWSYLYIYMYIYIYVYIRGTSYTSCICVMYNFETWR